MGNIQQGDIFINIPYFSYEIIQKVIPQNQIKKITPDKTDIIENLMKEGGSQYIKGFISTTLTILITQNCDIQNKDILIFLPLSESEIQKEEKYKEVKKHLRDNTDRAYLPKIEIYDKYFGPFFVKFDNPICLPKKIFNQFDSLKKNRIARLPDYSNKVVISKFNQYFARPPIDDYIYYDLQQLNDYINEEIVEKYYQEPEKIRSAKQNIEKALKDNGRGSILKDLIWIKLPKNLANLKDQIQKFVNNREFKNALKKKHDELQNIQSEAQEWLSMIEKYGVIVDRIQKRNLLKEIIERVTADNLFNTILADESMFQRHFPQIEIAKQKEYEKDRNYEKIRLLSSRKNILKKINQLAQKFEDL
ncbi:MAG: hypothetical protein GF364_06270 [Candidatus Lokiarchaeota archaeon]|nr:hypothetical protein [Candidatus Lokiarchaeota archaeon]